MATIQTGASVISSHSDLITSLAFSSHPYLATSSLDHTIRVASLDPASGEWNLDAQDWKAHDAPVLKLTWAHPEFGVLLASGGADGVVKLWAQEEVRQATTHHGRGAAGRGAGLNGAGAGAGVGAAGLTKRWVQRAALTDARGTIRDIGFAPPEFGLKLAAVSSDSHLRLWECLDPVSMQEWSLIEDIDLANLPVQPSSASSAGLGAGSLQAQQQAGAPGTGAGSNAGSLGGGQDNAGGLASPAKGTMTGTSGSSGLGLGSLGSAAGSGVGSMGSSASGSSFDGRRGGTVESDGGWSLSWCKEAWWGERLAVSAGNSGIIRLFHLPDHAPWVNYLNLLPPRASSSFPVTPPTSSLAWAPASGRSYQLLASGSRDGRARVWKLYPPSLEDEGATGPDGGAGIADEWRADMDAELEETKSARGGSVNSVRVEWNVTGTVLSTAGDDAKVRLWKSTYTGQWRPVAVLSTEDAEEGGMQVDK